MASVTSKASNEAQIRKLIDDWASAFRAKDIDRIMAYYAPDVVAFDVVPPLQYRGVQAYREDWEKMLPMCEGPIGCEMRDLTIGAGDDTAFCHCLNHFTGKKKEGGEIDTWMRVTVCYRKIDDRWLAVHEHVSVPIDMENGKGMFELKPT